MALKESDLLEQLDQQAVEHIFRQMPSVWLGGMLTGGIFIIGLWHTAPSSDLFLWYGAITLLLVYRYFLTIQYFHTGTRMRPPRYWGRALMRSSLYQGTIVGMAAILFLDPGSVSNQVLIMSMILAVSIASIPISSYWVSAFFAYTLTSTGLLAIKMFLVADTEHVVLGLLLVVYNLVVASFAWGVSRTLREGLRLRFENLDLIEELSQANRSKSRFLAAASHDLRQPVHSLALFNESLAPEVDTERGKALLVHINTTLDAHNRLLDSLLDISKLDAGVIEPHVTPLSLKALFEQLYHELNPRAMEKGLMLHMRACDDGVVSDAILLGNILRNLIGNAIRYTDEGWVMVACRQRGDKLLLQVWDSGSGIPEHEQEEIFQEFRQLHNPERDRSKGLGLGLAICRRLSALLGHELTLRSRPGYGSVFSLAVPRAQRLTPTGKSSDGKANLGRWDLTGRTVLVIDDELSVRQGMAMLLTRWGCEVLLAEGVESAVARCAEAANVDAIISDYRLCGNTTGVEAIAAVQGRTGKPIPAMLVTGDTSPTRLQEARESGLTLLHKPVQPAQMRAVLGQLLCDEAGKVNSSCKTASLTGRID